MHKKNAHSLRNLMPVLTCTFLLSFQWNAYAKTGEGIGLRLAADKSQTLYVNEDELMETAEKTYPCCSLFSVGDDFSSESGDGSAQCDVRNKPESTHDILMNWVITKEELHLHGLDTKELEDSAGDNDGRWAIAHTGLIEPGYRITQVQLLALPNGSVLPKGTYHLFLSEEYYDHETGEKYPYSADIPITLTIEG